MKHFKVGFKIITRNKYTRQHFEKLVDLALTRDDVDPDRLNPILKVIKDRDNSIFLITLSREAAEENEKEITKALKDIASQLKEVLEG